MPQDDFPLRLGGSLRGRVDHDGDVAVLRLAGEFDIAGVAAFEAVVADAEATRPRAIALDIQALVFMDSSGIRAVLGAHERAEGSHAFAVLSGSGPAYRALTLVGLGDALTMIDSVADLASGPPRPAAG